MKIAQIAPIIERVPPKKYGGTERVISALTEELVRRGHDVTLFATGDTVTGAKLSAVVPQGLREAGVTDVRERTGWTLHHIGAAYARAEEFDIIHDHCGVFSLPSSELSPTPVVQTMHGAFYDHNIHVFQALRKTNIVTISEDQGRGIPGMNVVSTIYNGLPMEHYPHRHPTEQFMLYVGRITPQKGTHIAVRLAKKLGMPLILAAKLEDEHREYFETEVQPYLSSTIQWIGEVNEIQRNDLMSRAACFIHPGTWREPFGLTLIEAMACGCPVVALRNGSIPEIIKHGVTGYIADDEEEMAHCIQAAHRIDRTTCRQYSLSQFSAKKMASEYELLYRLILESKHPKVERVSHTFYSHASELKKIHTPAYLYK